MKHVMIWIINLYRKFISPIKPPCCRFTPSCSAYALDAFRKRGFFVGFILTVWRILRCNPFSKGGYDPVPEKGFRNPPGLMPPAEFFGIYECDKTDGCDSGDNSDSIVAEEDTDSNKEKTESENRDSDITNLENK